MHRFSLPVLLLAAAVLTGGLVVVGIELAGDEEGAAPSRAETSRHAPGDDQADPAPDDDQADPAPDDGQAHPAPDDDQVGPTQEDESEEADEADLGPAEEGDGARSDADAAATAVPDREHGRLPETGGATLGAGTLSLLAGLGLLPRRRASGG